MVTGRRISRNKGHGHPRSSDEPHAAGAQPAEGRSVAEPESQGMKGCAGRGEGRKQLFHDSWPSIPRRWEVHPRAASRQALGCAIKTCSF